jgi:hypothetical protein
MSRFEVVDSERRALRQRQAVAVLVPAFLVMGTVVAVSARSRLTLPVLAIGLAMLPVLALVFHLIGVALVPAYRAGSERAGQLAKECASLRRHVATTFDGYGKRRKGEQFKTAYALAGKSMLEFEEALSIGMFRERREVFVTAFMRRGVVVRVTASIGSPYRCSAADNPARWAEHVERLECDEIRQYHNHPAHDGHTSPSRTDFRTTRALRKLLGAHAPKLRSFIICWNPIREWKVFEYDHRNRHWLCHEFDAATLLPAS